VSKVLYIHGWLLLVSLKSQQLQKENQTEIEATNRWGISWRSFARNDKTVSLSYPHFFFVCVSSSLTSFLLPLHVSSDN
jgi:hypothetical protein